MTTKRVTISKLSDNPPSRRKYVLRASGPAIDEALAAGLITNADLFRDGPHITSSEFLAELEAKGVRV
ncbi:MAG: hypothetical protein HYY95_22510 [Candidatus Rokubacteria bacterium]|nr:hypothetical protein [Candidatus Rokubacteria bacterium]